MTKFDYMAIGIWILLIFLWSMTIFGGWAERNYIRYQNASWPWYWLRLFNAKVDKNNCIRFQKIVSTIGIVLVTAGTIAIIIMNHITRK